MKLKDLPFELEDSKSHEVYEKIKHAVPHIVLMYKELVESEDYDSNKEYAPDGFIGEDGIVYAFTHLPNGKVRLETDKISREILGHLKHSHPEVRKRVRNISPKEEK